MPLLPSNTTPTTTQASFLPEDYIARKIEFRNNVITLGLFALVMAGSVGAFFVTTLQWSRTKNRYEEVTAACEAEKKKLEQLDQLRVQRAAMMEKAQITAALIERVPRWAILGEIDFRAPQSVRLSDFALKGTRNEQSTKAVASGPKIKSLTDLVSSEQQAQKAQVHAPSFTYALTIVGTAENNNDVADYLASLKRSPVLRNVELNYIRDFRDEELMLRTFEVTAQVRGDVDQKALSDSLQDLVNQRTANANKPQGTQQASQQPPAQQPGAQAAPQVSDAESTKGGN